MINRRLSYITISVFLILAVLVSSQIRNIKFDYELENFFSIGDPDLGYHKQFSEKFESDSDHILISFESSNGIFNTGFLTSVSEASIAISKLEQTEKLNSLLEQSNIIQTTMGLIAVPFLHLDEPAKLTQDSINLAKTPELERFYISKDGKSIKIILFHQHIIDKKIGDQYINQINNILKNVKTKRPSPQNKELKSMDNHPVIKKTRIIGKLIAQKTFVSTVEEDFSFFIIGAFLLISILLLYFIRNIALVITCLGIAGLSISTTLGVMVFLGKEIDVLSSLIPTILLVVAMSDMIHLFTKIRREQVAGVEIKQAIRNSISTIGLATLFTSFTTAIGFLTLISINVRPIIDLGLYAALGIVITFLMTYIFFPQVAYLTNQRVETKNDTSWLEDKLNSLYELIKHRKKEIGLLWVLLLIIVSGGIFRLEYNAFLIDELPDGSPAKEDFQFFDDQYAGTRPFTLSVWLVDSSLSIYSPSIIKEISKIEQIIKGKMQVGDLISPTTFVKAFNQSIHGGKASEYRLPMDDKSWRDVIHLISRTRPERKTTKVSMQYECQIRGFYKDEGSKRGSLKSAALTEELDNKINKSLLSYRLTGTAQLIDKSQKNLPNNLIKGLLSAMLIVSLITAWIFKSWRMILITIIPNLLPIAVTAGVMGYFGIPINLSTSIIFAISFGIVVDDTIHFLVKFKEEYNAGVSTHEAVKRTLICTGEPILMTTIILTTGFLVFCFSSFSATFYTGLFVCIAFIVAVLADLVLLPVLLLYLMPNKKSKDEV